MTAGSLSGEEACVISDTAGLITPRPSNVLLVQARFTGGGGWGGTPLRWHLQQARTCLWSSDWRQTVNPRRSEDRTGFGPRRRCLCRGRTNRGSSRGAKSSRCRGNQSLVMYKHEAEHVAKTNTASEIRSGGVAEIDTKMNWGVKLPFLK